MALERQKVAQLVLSVERLDRRSEGRHVFVSGHGHAVAVSVRTDDDEHVLEVRANEFRVERLSAELFGLKDDCYDVVPDVTLAQ